MGQNSREETIELAKEAKLKSRLSGKKSYLGRPDTKLKAQSDHRRSTVKASLFSAIDDDDDSDSSFRGDDSFCIGDLNDAPKPIKKSKKKPPTRNHSDSDIQFVETPRTMIRKGKKNDILAASGAGPSPTAPSPKPSSKGIKKFARRLSGSGRRKDKDKELSNSTHSTGKLAKARKELSSSTHSTGKQAKAKKELSNSTHSLGKPSKSNDDSISSLGTSQRRRARGGAGGVPPPPPPPDDSYYNGSGASLAYDSDSDDDERRPIEGPGAEGWMAWAAEKALKPLEMMYDDLNG